MRNFLGLLEGFKYYLSMPAVWIALAVVIIGATMVFVARRVVRAIRKENDIADNDGYLIAIKCIGVVLMFVGVLIVVFI